MAQDFGDDMGNALLNFVTRQTENYLRFGRGRERAFDWWQRHYKKEGNTPEQAKAMAEKQSSREQVVVPFGTSEEAAYYAQVCRENGTYAAAYTDKQGNGFLAFAKEDAKTVAGYAPQFKDVMARLDEQRITDALNHAEPVDKKTMDSLTELTSYPDLPAEDVTVIPVTIRYKDAPEETYDVLFSEQDTENLNIDDSICFSGYSHKELTEMVGRETHEDFDVISVRKASERARKNGKGTRQVKKDKVLAYLTEHPEATNTEVAEKTGVSRPSVIKYRKEYAPALPAPKGGKIVKDDGTKVGTVKIDGVKVDSFDGKVDVNFDVKVDSDFDTGFYTDADGKSAGRQSARAENEAVKIASRPKNIDDRYKNTSTSTAIADGEGTTGSGIPTREEVRSHFAEMGFAVDPDRFFDVNEGRGWRTNSGKPVDDWKKLAAVWDRNEHPKAATPPARTEPKANAVGKIPSVEEVMAKWGCDRETAQGYIDENMY